MSDPDDGDGAYYGWGLRPPLVVSKHKVSELEGTLLDAAVAKAEGLVWRLVPPGNWPVDDKVVMAEGVPRRYSRGWADGGAIIERERIHLIAANFDGPAIWIARLYAPPLTHGGEGQTPLIAAMRAYCASVFGEDVALP